MPTDVSPEESEFYRIMFSTRENALTEGDLDMVESIDHSLRERAKLRRDRGTERNIRRRELTTLTSEDLRVDADDDSST